MSKWHSVPLAAAALLLFTQTGLAQDREMGGGMTFLPKSFAALEIKLEPTFEFSFAEHAANGVALRNRSAGTIHLRGIPQKRKVIRALLYWNFSDLNDEGKRRLSVLFNGNNVAGEKTADNVDPCWGMAGNHTYRADVTRFIPAEDPNQDYRVVTLFDDGTSTTGQNPWRSPEVQNRRMEGAWLVVIYASDQDTGVPPRSVAIYDGLAGTTMIGTDLIASLIHPLINGGEGLFTMFGADGQRGSGHNTTSLANEKTFFNGNQIAGPFDPALPPIPLPLSASDWDGSDGWPLTQLADTHTHAVELEPGVSTVEYQVGGDCLTPVAFMIEGLL